MGKNRSLLVLVLSAVVFLAAACDREERSIVPGPNAEPEGFRTEAAVTLAGKNLQVEVADTALDQAVGLSKYSEIDENHGMLFPINPPRQPEFWMKNMQFAIDIIWIKDGKVADITSYVPTDPGKEDWELQTYSPGVAVDYVLEVNAGWVAKNGLRIGDTVELGYRL